MVLLWMLVPFMMISTIYVVLHRPFKNTNNNVNLHSPEMTKKLKLSRMLIMLNQSNIATSFNVALYIYISFPFIYSYDSLACNCPLLPRDVYWPLLGTIMILITSYVLTLLFYEEIFTIKKTCVNC